LIGLVTLVWPFVWLFTMCPLFGNPCNCIITISDAIFFWVPKIQTSWNQQPKNVKIGCAFDNKTFYVLDWKFSLTTLLCRWWLENLVWNVQGHQHQIPLPSRPPTYADIKVRKHVNHNMCDSFFYVAWNIEVRLTNHSWELGIVKNLDLLLLRKLLTIGNQVYKICTHMWIDVTTT
jgi:hypothetical protein